jgi:hypothetical protein
MKRSLFALLASLAFTAGLVASAVAADVPPSAPVFTAPPSFVVANGYPYETAGLFFGLFTEGGGGSVNASVPGVVAGSLTTTQAGLGVTAGYAWGQKGNPFAFSLEGDFGWTNFNGGTAGLSVSGPLFFEQRFVVFTPYKTIADLFPSFPNIGTLPPFSALPAGVTASNQQLGLLVGLREEDISLAFPGLAANREWHFAPEIGLAQMEQLSNHSAMRTWFKTVFPGDKGLCVGPIAKACASLGQQYKVGVGVYF